MCSRFIFKSKCFRIKRATIQDHPYTDTANIPGLPTQPDQRITPYAEVYLGRSTYPRHYVSTVEAPLRHGNHSAAHPGYSPHGALDHGDGYEIPVARQYHLNTAANVMVCDGIDDARVMTNFESRQHQCENEEDIITAM